MLINHHTITDGIGSNLIIAKMVDSQSKETFPPFKKLTWYDAF